MHRSLIESLRGDSAAPAGHVATLLGYETVPPSARSLRCDRTSRLSPPKEKQSGRMMRRRPEGPDEGEQVDGEEEGAEAHPGEAVREVRELQPYDAHPVPATDQQMDTPDGRSEAKKSIKQLLQEKFENPATEKTGKASKDILFLRKKLRF